MLRLAAVALCVCAVAHAQSERPAPPYETLLTEVNTVVIEKRSQVPTGQEYAPHAIVVSVYNQDDAIPAGSMREFSNSFIAGLKRAPGITVFTAPEMSRAVAAARARNERESFVAWLWLHPDRANGSAPRTGLSAQRGFILNYVLFAPGTGRVKTEGRVYYQPPIQIVASETKGQRQAPLAHLPRSITVAGAAREAIEHVLAGLK